MPLYNGLYLLKIKMIEIEPEIWRRFAVPSDITFDRLHDVIQIVMGWTDSHLHEFIIGEEKYTESPRDDKDGKEGGKFSLGSVVKEKGINFQYIYDFGDYWKHEITLEDNNYSNPDLQCPIECLGGARACPPEDAGGTVGYFEFCEAVKNPKHKEHKSSMLWYSSAPWYGEDFQSEKFDIGKTNYELTKYLRYSRNRFNTWDSGY
jgi:hypothetical protein